MAATALQGTLSACTEVVFTDCARRVSEPKFWPDGNKAKVEPCFSATKFGFPSYPSATLKREIAMSNQNQNPGQQNQKPGQKPGQQQGGGQKPGQQQQDPNRQGQNPEKGR